MKTSPLFVQSIVVQKCKKLGGWQILKPIEPHLSLNGKEVAGVCYLQSR